MIEILFGIAVGILLGLIPGFHINNFLPFFIFLPFVDEVMFLFIIAASIAYVFSSFFPSILLGVPNSETALSVLPGHKMVQEGRGYSAVMFSIYGGLLSLIFSTIILIPFYLLIPTIYDSLSFLMPYMLFIILAALVLTDKPISILVVVLSGSLGWLTFGYDYLLPLLTGFFALSTLLVSLNSKTKLPAQLIEFDPKLSWFEMSRTAFLSSFLGSIFSIFPAISSNITAIIGKLFGKMEKEEFLVFISGTNVTYMMFSFYAMILLQKMRSGSAVFLSQFQMQHILFILGTVLVSGTMAAFACIFLAPNFVQLYKKINYQLITICSIIFLIAVNFLFTSFMGLLILFASTSLGIACVYLKARRINCMAALIIPTIVVLL